MKNRLPDKLKNATRDTKWLENVSYEIENEHWLDMSFEIALRVYDQIKTLSKTQKWLAEKLDVSPQYVSKIIKGKENLTLETISKLEKVLDINLITLATPTRVIEVGLEINPKVPNIGPLSVTYGNKSEVTPENVDDFETFTLAG